MTHFSVGAGVGRDGSLEGEPDGTGVAVGSGEGSVVRETSDVSLE